VSAADWVRALVEPPLVDQGFEVVDVEQRGATLRVVVDRPGGVDLDAIADATTVVSEVLDRHDPVPGRYVLEVSSPGVERPLRVPAHFQRAVGATVALTTRDDGEGAGHIRGVLEAADDGGVVVDGRRLAYEEIIRARTVLEWGAGPRPSPSRRKKARAR
jgi:ribosome maturation factor RimP